MKSLRLIHQSLVVALLMSFQLTAQSPASQQKAQKEDSKIVEDYAVTWIDIGAVSRSTGSPVTDLVHEDLIISENGIRQVVAAWEHVPLPLSLMLLVDIANNYSDSHKLEAEVNSLRSALNLMLRPEDEVSVMALTSEPLLLQDYTANRELINEGLKSVLRCTRVPVVPAEKRLRIGIQEAAKRGEQFHKTGYRRATVFISDLSQKAADKIVLPEWIVRTVLGSAGIFCWKRPTQLPPQSYQTSDAAFDFEKVTITSLVGLTGGEFVSTDWGHLLERFRERYQIAYWPNTLGRTGDVVRINLKLIQSPKRDMRDLVLTYPRFAIIP